MNTENDSITMPFTKMTGAGNDFVLVDNRREEFHIPWNKFASTVCNRRYGIGADGLLVIEPSTTVDFTMRYFNADGSYGGMCGNGGRCVSRYIMHEKKSDHVMFEALNYNYSARVVGQDVSLKMKDPQMLRLNVPIECQGHRFKLHYVDTGAPHVVVYVSELPKALQSEINNTGIHEIGKAIRFHSDFSPEGTNVDFICILDDHSISMRTYERGVEGETLACGTGAVACSVIVHKVQGFPAPLSVRTQGGEVLTVKFSSENESLKHVELTGSAVITFRGEYKYHLPKPRAIR
jgi:diaminopimelate epimerase